MPASEDLAEVVRLLGGLRSHAGQYLAREARLAETGYVWAVDAKAAGDTLGAALWKRLALEAVLRIAWIAGDRWLPDHDGELLVDESDVATRCLRLEKRDTLNLGSAHKAVTLAADREVAADIGEALRAKRADPLEAAPPTLSDLATNRTQLALYAQFRLCSTVVHPGALGEDEKAQRLATELLEEVAVLAVACLRPMYRALTP